MGKDKRHIQEIRGRVLERFQLQTLENDGQLNPGHA
jgi:hypothetical protein